MKFSIAFALAWSQNLCHAETDTDILYKLWNGIQNIQKHVSPSKAGSQKFLQFQYILFIKK